MTVHSVGSHMCDIYGRPRNVPCPRSCTKEDSIYGIKPIGNINFEEELRKGIGNFTLGNIIS